MVSPEKSLSVTSPSSDLLGLASPNGQKNPEPLTQNSCYLASESDSAIPYITQGLGCSHPLHLVGGDDHRRYHGFFIEGEPHTVEHLL